MILFVALFDFLLSLILFSLTFPQQKERGGPATQEDIESCMLNKVNIESYEFCRYTVGYNKSGVF